ncbi:TlyA family RNA methyltransferase [Anaerofustis sp.]|uniref:TlyA family RNA methyltransferase n=1 Tax=Anaerofustis sp. TaxID=1872517 RepID=UPI0025BD9717|nr:TlyA family RNA methyltransferase [Anaerofustis sp.]
MNKKERLDVLLFESGMAESREKAKRLIMAGLVFVNDQRIDKAGTKVDIYSNIMIKGNDNPFVSRGGFKLDKAIKVFDVDVKDKTCMDIGASSGGFTDCLLQNGAEKVYSIDVGYGQFAYKLRKDPRVVCLEKTNFRNMEFEKIGETVDIAVMDVSFISILKLADNLLKFLKDDGIYICLIKPQFEAGRELVGNGIIKDINIHKKVVKDVIYGLKDKGLYVEKLDYSPIKGPKGNREFIALVTKNKDNLLDIDLAVEECVEKSHKELN